MTSHRSDDKVAGGRALGSDSEDENKDEDAAEDLLQAMDAQIAQIGSVGQVSNTQPNILAAYYSD